MTAAFDGGQLSQDDGILLLATADKALGLSHQMASNQTSCRSPLANQMRLFLHTAAYWLILKSKENIPQHHQLGAADFSTIRLKLLKISVRVIEASTRIRLAFASSHPHASLFRFLIVALKTASP